MREQERTLAKHREPDSGRDGAGAKYMLCCLNILQEKTASWIFRLSESRQITIQTTMSDRKAGFTAQVIAAVVRQVGQMHYLRVDILVNMHNCTLRTL